MQLKNLQNEFYDKKFGSAQKQRVLIYNKNGNI